MSTVHKNLTGADLHESKGVDTALNGTVYVANGVGSGSWTAASSVITNTAFTTGDLKPTHKVTADTSWILWSDGTIGDGSSGASIRANADTAALFALYWNNYSNTLCPVSAGRGASATADYGLHKTISLPIGAGRVLGLSGSGSGLTARTSGTTTGQETFSLTTTNLPPYTPSGSVAINAGNMNSSGASNAAPGSTIAGATGITGLSATFTGTAQGGISTAFTLMQPTSFVNVMIKL